MGQIFCKDCCEAAFKKSAVVDWDDDDAPWQYGDRGTSSPGANSSLKSYPSSGDLERKRTDRIKHKKRCVKLHAEFRDRVNDLLLAPPLVTEKVMEDTDNMFTGQDLGVETLHSGLASTSVEGVPQDQQHTGFISESCKGQKLEKSPLEDAFLDRALSDDYNFVFDGLTLGMRQKLKDHAERVVVPKNTLLIKKGDDPDYLYIIFEGDVAVYIDENERLDENATGLGKHAPIDISLKRKSSVLSLGSTSLTSNVTGRLEPEKREFKQSYVLNLRKSMFTSFKENNPGEENDSFVGQVLSLVRGSFSGQDLNSSVLTGIMEDTTSSASDEDAIASFTPLNELRGLNHERDLDTGDVFGELGIIYNCPRTASCLTTTKCILFRVHGNMFRSVLSSSNSDRAKKRYTESKAALESLYNIGVVEELDEKTLGDIEKVLNPVTFEKDDRVINKGAYDNMMFFVMSGKLLAHDIGTGDSMKSDVELGEGGHFGELSLLTGWPSVANVTVLTPKARLMAVTKTNYIKRRQSLEPLMRKLWLQSALLTIPSIAKSKLMSLEINQLVHKLERVSFPRGKISFTENMKSAVFIVETGKIQMTVADDDGVVYTFDPHDHFGGRSLFDDQFFQRKNVQVRAVLPTECMMLTRNAIVSVIGRINRLGKPSIPVSRKLIKGLKKTDIIFHRIVGVGMFGRVWLVQHNISKTVYALKVMDKKEIHDKKMSKGVMREKNVMASVEHPFISNLVSSFQDTHHLYMLMSYVQGGELFGLIYNVSKRGYLSNDAAAFYGAGLVEALTHLHSRNICHRDLKPENILINGDGYVVLIDFGFAKVVLDKTYTTCGSPEYMAPEILLGKGHTLSVDHWSLGVVLYEMLVGQSPFIHVGATKMTLFRRICNGSFAFPNAKKHGIEVSDHAKLLIRGLLNKKCEERIGSSITLGDEEIASNPFFQGLLTEYKHAFLSEKVTPPWLPDIDNELDASYFGKHEHVEKEARSKKKGAVLDKKAQQMFEGF